MKPNMCFKTKIFTPVTYDKYIDVCVYINFSCTAYFRKIIAPSLLFSFSVSIFFLLFSPSPLCI